MSKSDKFVVIIVLTACVFLGINYFLLKSAENSIESIKSNYLAILKGNDASEPETLGLERIIENQVGSINLLSKAAKQEQKQEETDIKKLVEASAYLREYNQYSFRKSESTQDYYAKLTVDRDRFTRYKDIIQQNSSIQDKKPVIYSMNKDSFESKTKRQEGNNAALNIQVNPNRKDYPEQKITSPINLLQASSEEEAVTQIIEQTEKSSSSANFGIFVALFCLLVLVAMLLTVVELIAGKNEDDSSYNLNYRLLDEQDSIDLRIL